MPEMCLGVSRKNGVKATSQKGEITMYTHKQHTHLEDVRDSLLCDDIKCRAFQKAMDYRAS